MWNRLIETNLRESKRTASNRVAGNRFDWLLLVAIVLAALYATSFPARLTFYQSPPKSCGTVSPGQTARASVDEAYKCLVQAFQTCQTRQLNTQIERLAWVVRVVPLSRGCTLGIWLTEYGIDRQYASGPYACRGLAPEWYGLRLRNCDRFDEILLSDGVPGNPPGAVSCGTVRIALSADPLVDASRAQAVESCFAQAVFACQPAVLVVEVVPTLVAPPSNTDAQTLLFHTAFAVVPYRDACAAVPLELDLPACTLSAQVSPDGLHITCSDGRDLAVPSGAGPQDAPFTGQHCGAIQFREDSTSVPADKTTASVVENCFLSAWAGCESARMEAVNGIEESVFTVVPSGSTCRLFFHYAVFEPNQWTMNHSQMMTCSSVVEIAGDKAGLHFTDCGGGTDIFIFATRQPLDCASTVRPSAATSAEAANCLLYAK